MKYEVELRVRKVEFVEKEERVYGIVDLESKEVYVYEWSGGMEIMREFEKVCRGLGIRRIELDWEEEKKELEKENWKKVVIRYSKEL